MKKIGMIIVIAITVMACSKENENTMYVKASVKGLKKGTFIIKGTGSPATRAKRVNKSW